jgi:hypothetical protein
MNGHGSNEKEAGAMEITYSQFLKYVLKQEPVNTESIKEDYTSLIKLLENLTSG